MAPNAPHDFCSCDGGPFSGGAFAASSASTRNMPDATVGDVVSTPDPQGHQVTDAVSAVVVDYSEVNGGVHWEGR